LQKHPLDQLHDDKRTLIDKVRELEENLVRIRATNIPLIRQTSKEADRLATVFRDLYSQSDTARMADDIETANQLSSEGKSTEAECRRLNAQVNAWRKEIRDAEEAIIQAKQAIAKVNGRIKSYERVLQITIDGFEQAHGVSAEIVREELSVLPMSILQHIKRVRYEHQAFRTGEVGRTARKEENPDQTTISLFVDSTYFKHWDKAKLEESYRHSIIHEAGHVFFDWVLKDEERTEWGELYLDTKRRGGKFITENAEVSKREDFGECFHVYIHDPLALREYDEGSGALVKNGQGRYTFIERIYKEVSGE
jgi:outer membrane murein-binding lipoprotein Lpp